MSGRGHPLPGSDEARHNEIPEHLADAEPLVASSVEDEEEEEWGICILPTSPRPILRSSSLCADASAAR